MAINISKLIIAPPLRQYFTDPDTLLPVVGTITFYKEDKITLKNIYRPSGDSNDPFIVATNPIDLDISGAIPYVLYLYPYDEDDETVKENYYIEVRRDDNTLIFSLDEFPFSAMSDTNDDGSSLDNKCPSYGFDNPVSALEYTQALENPIPEQWATDLQNGARVSQGWTWQLTDTSISNFYYYVTPISSGTLDGNPLYLLNLSGTNITGQSINDLKFILCYGNELVDQQINYQFYIQDNIIGSGITSLNIYVQSDVDGDIINVGTVSISNSLTTQTISFTMPELTLESDYENAPTYLIVRFPTTSSEFDMNITGTYCYFGDIATINRLPLAYGLRQSNKFLSNPEDDLIKIEDTYNSSTLPLVNRKGRLSTLRTTGEIFFAGTTYDASTSNAHELDGTTLVYGEDILDTLTNRYFDEGGIYSSAGNSFNIISQTSTSFVITTNVVQPTLISWTSSEPASISITLNNSDLTLLSSSIDGGDDRILNITFNSNFNAQSTQNLDTQSVQSKNSWYRGTGYISRVIIPVIGTYQYISSSFGQLNYVHNDSIMTSTNVAVGTVGTPAQCQLQFFGNPNIVTIKTGTLTYNLAPNVTNGLITVFNNYLAFNGETYTLCPDPPEYTINFHVDGVGSTARSSIHSYVVNLDSSQINDGSYVAFQVNSVLSYGNEYEIDVLSLPSNGTTLYISTTNRKINIVFYDTTQTKPAIPDDLVSTIYLEYTPTTTLEELTSDLISLFTTKIGGIPTPQDLELNYINDNIRYFVRL